MGVALHPELQARLRAERDGGPLMSDDDLDVNHVSEVNVVSDVSDVNSTDRVAPTRADTRRSPLRRGDCIAKSPTRVLHDR